MPAAIAAARIIKIGITLFITMNLANSNIDSRAIVESD
jgi:hypothetical protein